MQSRTQRMPTRRTGGPVVSWRPVRQGLPAISVGLAVRNGSSVLARCIESVLSQDFADLELVICDNVSEDGTIPLLERYASADARIVLHLNEANIGSQP